MITDDDIKTALNFPEESPCFKAIRSLIERSKPEGWNDALAT